MQHNSPRFKSTLILSTAMALTIISIDKAWGDNTHFIDNAIDKEAATPSLVEAKAAEFQKVLQDVGGENNANAATESTTEPSQPETASLEVVSLDTLPESTSNTSAEVLTDSAATTESNQIPKFKIEPNTESVVHAEESQPPHSEGIFTAEAKPSVQEEVITETETTPVLEIIPTEETPPLVIKDPSLENMRDLASIQNGRSPLGILESNRDLGTQQWYLYSSARRGIKNPNDVIEIVSVVGENDPINRGEEVKALLIEKSKGGIKPENIKIVAAKGDESQIGKIYIFGK